MLQGMLISIRTALHYCRLDAQRLQLLRWCSDVPTDKPLLTLDITRHSSVVSLPVTGRVVLQFIS